MLKQIKLLFWLIAINSTVLLAQENSIKQNSFVLDIGLHLQSTTESRMSARTRFYSGFYVGLGMDFLRTDKLHQVQVRFSKNFVSRKYISSFHHLKPELRYAFLRQWKESKLFVGGYAGIGSFLSFPAGRWRGNNTIAYTMWNSYGISMQHQHNFELGKTRLNHRTQFSIPVLAYVVRPGYGLPYPDNFLEDGIFDFQLNGMAKYILTNGKIYTLNRFQNIEFRTGLSLPLGKGKSQIGLDYQLSFLQFQKRERLRQWQNNLLLTVKI